jgi:signal transduction histidine kinase
VQSDSERPIADLKEAVLRLERGQRLIPLPPPASCDVGRVARAAVQIARSTLDASTKLRLTLAATPAAKIDANDLGQVLLHLIAYAARMAEQASERTIEIEVGEGAASVVVVVSHSGSVVPRDHLARIFDPYFALATGAGGIGLALVKQLVERAGGSVRVEPEEAGGARFTIQLSASEGMSLG